MLACCPVCFISTRIILKNPIYFAKIIPVSEKDVLNRPPLKDMSAYLHGKEVSYKLPVLLKEETLSEVKPFIGNSKKDFDRIIGINLWVREKLKFGDNFRHYFFWTPEEVIRDAENGHTFFCDAYARLAAAAAQSIGICARVFWLDGHVVPSFYVSEMRKWVMT